MTLDTDFTKRRRSAANLASKFWNLLGRPEKYQTDAIVELWTQEFVHVLNQRGATEEYIKEVLVWAFASSFWIRRIYIAKHVSDNWDSISDAYEADRRGRRLEELDSCLCPTINGERIDPRTDTVLPFDWKCPKHGPKGKFSMVGQYSIIWVNKPGEITREQWYEQRKRSKAK